MVTFQKAVYPNEVERDAAIEWIRAVERMHGRRCASARTDIGPYPPYAVVVVMHEWESEPIPLEVEEAGNE